MWRRDSRTSAIYRQIWRLYAEADQLAARLADELNTVPVETGDPTALAYFSRVYDVWDRAKARAVKRKARLEQLERGGAL